MNIKTMIIGASTNPARYSYKAVLALIKNNHKVVPLGIKKGNIDGIKIENSLTFHDNIHTISLYIGLETQQKYKKYIISLQPQRIIFNPGTENQNMMDFCKQNNIEVLEACTLVLLATNQY